MHRLTCVGTLDIYYRQSVLLQSLLNTLGPTFVDADTVHLTGQYERYRYSVGDIKSILADYKTNTIRKQVEDAKSITCEDLREMVFFHCRFVRPFVRWFAQRTRREFDSQIGRETSDFRLSDVEQMRFTRAAYRFQLLCQFFGPDTRFPPWIRARTWVVAFANLFEPREIEELVSAYEFVCEGYYLITRHYQKKEFESGRSFGGPPFRYQLNGQPSCEAADMYFYLEGTTLLGLPFFHDAISPVVNRTMDPLANALAVVPQMERSFCPILSWSEFLGNGCYDGVFDTRCIARRRGTEILEPMTDTSPSASGEDAEVPPLGWSVMWGDRYNDRYRALAVSMWRGCGYVFWDARSLEDGGERTAHEMLTSLRDNWEADWLPREDRESTWEESVYGLTGVCLD
ncbi:hypothetical protein GGR57DRAFT_438190 [Xylariaceae sp. FL1272]|nr:hypothetical protein GGR57DRAFT_438190 [Xylariaceae sp. FL1272]